MLTTVEVETNLPEIAKSPVLQAAIDGLDLTLHDELERYRRWCEQGKSFSAWQTPNFYREINPEPKPINLGSDIPISEPHAEPMSSALIPISPPESEPAIAEEEDILQEWASDYRQQIATPLDVQVPPSRDYHQAQKNQVVTELETPPPSNTAQAETPAVTTEEEEFPIGIAGVVSLVLIVLSGTAIAMLWFDPFGWLRSKPSAPPPPSPNSPSSQVVPESATPRLIDPSLLPHKTSQPTKVALPAPNPAPQPQLVAVTVPVIPAPARVVTTPPTPKEEAKVARVEPQNELKPSAPTPESVTSNPTPELPQVKYTDPITGQEIPTPVATMTIPPAPPEGGNFVVVADSSYKAYVQPLVQPIDRPNGKIQLGAYGDPNTAQQKAEEWRRYGVPAVVVPR